jgi:CheY-like chemotaxis protein
LPCRILVCCKKYFSTARVNNSVNNLLPSERRDEQARATAALPRFEAARPRRRRRRFVPCSKGRSLDILPPMPTSNAFPSRGRVLAVDDSYVMRELVTLSLEAAGYSVEAVASGDAALVAAAREEFDAFILDVDMPGMDGLAVGRALRKDPRTRSSMIAMHTSLDEADVRTGFDGYNAYLRKPFDARRLGECVDRMLRDRRLRARDD